MQFHTLSTMRDDPMTHSSAPGTREGTTVLKLLGPLTLSTIFGFQNDFRKMKPKVLILDLTETPYMDSAGLGLTYELHGGCP